MYGIIVWKLLLIKQLNHFLNRVMILSSDKNGFHFFRIQNLSTVLNVLHIFFHQLGIEMWFWVGFACVDKYVFSRWKITSAKIAMMCYFDGLACISIKVHVNSLRNKTKRAHRQTHSSDTHTDTFEIVFIHLEMACWV